jgi:nickel-dependent lactate racemase
MTQHNLPYGTNFIEINIPDQYPVDIIIPSEVTAVAHPLHTVKEAISCSVNNQKLGPFTRHQSVAIAVNDKTRPVPHQYLLPPLLEHLESAGIERTRIHLIAATGTHLPMRQDEFAGILPNSIRKNYACCSHDCDSPDLIFLGKTSRSTPVYMNRLFMNSDLKIVVGNIEPHHFMGFSGGVKTAAIGLAGRATIIENHSMLTNPEAKTGHYSDNPMRQDIEEIGRLIGVDFALNAILNDKKEIVKVLFGDPAAVMEAGIPLARQICQVQIPHPYDFIIASAGGYPKDINLYQAQKALTHAAMMTRDGGEILLVAACLEGLGSYGFEQFMEGVSSFEQVFAKFAQQSFQVGPHKAYQIARDASRVNITLFSEIESAKVKKVLLTPTYNVNQTICDILSKLPSDCRIAIMPLAPITIPILTSEV